MAKVRIGQEAEVEYADALAWYDARSPRAAQGFEAAFEEALERIGESPNTYAQCDEEGFQYMTLARYPYSLIYRVVDATVQIVAVAHGRRNPKYWSDRK